MKTLRIFSTKTDPYLLQFRDEAKAIGLKVNLYIYERFSFADNHLTYTGRKGFPDFTNQDVVLFRRCAYEKKRQHFWLRLLATLARDAGATVLNEDFMVNFPLHSGKLFPAAYFAAQGIPHISTYRLSRKLEGVTYPLIIKKRYTAFAKDSRIIQSPTALVVAKQQIRHLDDFVVQPFLSLDRDIRVLILNGQVVGAVERQVSLKADGGLGVKVGQTTQLTKAEQAIVNQVLAVFDLDLAGLDLFTSQSGKTWLGEINFFPNFAGYIRETGENIFQQILLMMAQG